MRATALLVALGISLAPLASAFGESPDAKERAAKKACMTGDPAKGVEILADLYIDTNNPTYIFNQGRCLEQNHKCEDAIERFREYQRKIGDQAVQERAEAQKHIRECQAVLGINEGAREPSGPVPGPLVDAPIIAALPRPVATTSAAAPDLAPKPGAGLRTAGIVTGSVGAAAVVAGLLFNLRYNSGIGDIEAKYDKDKQSSNDTNKTLAVVGYAVGGACLVGGAILYYVGWNKGRLVATPAPVAGGPGALIAGVF